MNEGEIIIHTDGGARGNPGPAACAFVAEVEGKIVQQESKFLGDATNNHAEYQGVIMALRWVAVKYQLPNTGYQIYFYLDSELVVKQLNGAYKTKNKNLKNLNDQIKKCILENNLKVLFRHVPREENKIADFLVNKELDENYDK